MQMSKLKKIYYPAISLIYVGFPFLVGAVADPTKLTAPLIKVGGVLNTVIGILFVLATVIFLWGVIQFIASSGSEEGRKKAKGIMTWGIIGLAVMAAAWGVANILISFFGVSSGRITPISLPK